MSSQNKQALIRYKIIDRLISNKNYPSMNKFIDICEEELGKKFSKETIQKDIEAMKNDQSLDFNAPIKYDRYYRGYTYTEENYTIKNLNLNYKEIDVLENIIDILKQFKGTRLGENYNSAVDKIATSIRSNVESRKNNIISLEPQSEYVDLEDIEDYIRYIKEQIPISVIVAYDIEFFGDIIHPYLLKEYQNRWYIIAYSETYDEIKVYDLRYLYDIYILSKRKFIYKEFDEDVFFKHSIGVSIQHNFLVDIKIEFIHAVYNEVNSIPIHPSQHFVKQKANGNFIIEISVYVSNEFFNKILSFGASAKILKPKWVVGMMKCYIQTMSNLYKISGQECSKKYRITTSKSSK